MLIVSRLNGYTFKRVNPGCPTGSSNFAEPAANQVVVLLVCRVLDSVFQNV